ncbi:acyl carrier protein [Paenibacillus sp. GXUN7292]|uniref:acyl carrier protein n=1 Tax=Paenibacillus sp. GXUN7292 TaxID=3422499 RepID=UPI003D7E0AA1
MTNEQLYKDVFITTFNVEDNHILLNLEYNTIDEWDSIGHMQLVAALETTFDVMLDMDDIIDLSSFSKGKEILGKYNIQF